MKNKSKNWLVTGCSAGLGKALAEKLIEQGENIIATARNPDSLANLIEGKSNARAFKLDVTSKNDIENIIKFVENEFGHIDVLVNNAGYGFISSVEEAEEDDYRALFETNVFGLMELTRAVLPLMRKQKSGHIVNVASIGGVIGNPGSGFYAATKFAVVGFTEALSKEIAHLRIKATVIEPGAFRTDWAGRSLKASKFKFADYDKPVHERIKKMNTDNGTQPGDPARAADAMISAINSDTPPLHLVLGSDGYNLVKNQFTALTDELEQWKDTTVSTDYQ